MTDIPDWTRAADALEEEVDEDSNLAGQVSSFRPDRVDILRRHAVVAEHLNQTTFGEVGTHDERLDPTDARSV